MQSLQKQFGPILYIDDVSRDQASYRILYACLHQPEMKVRDASEQKVELISILGDLKFWLCSFHIKREMASQKIEYSVDDRAYFFHNKGYEDITLCAAYVSCNGSERDRPHLAILPGRNSMWEHLYQVHQQKPFHVLLHGGDQIYADGIWSEIEELKSWLELPRSKQLTYVLKEETIALIRAYYFNCYMHHWSQAHIKDAMAHIPSFMMWDDHDIFDGYGSWGETYQSCPVYQAIFNVAREAFLLFQRGTKDQYRKMQLNQFFSYDDCLFIAPDLRSERTLNQVLSSHSWQWLEDIFKQNTHKKNVVLMSSVPLATSHFSMLDPILTGFPSFIAEKLPRHLNPKRFADDIHDQWRVKAHRDEWYKMLNLLLNRVEQNQQKIAVLSGEIHLGARSTIKRGPYTVMQYIASAISHPPAHPFIAWACEFLSKDRQDLRGHIDIRMEKLFERGLKRYLRARNWLALEIDQRGGYDATWHGENVPSLKHSWKD